MVFDVDGQQGLRRDADALRLCVAGETIDGCRRTTTVRVELRSGGSHPWKARGKRYEAAAKAVVDETAATSDTDIDVQGRVDR